MTHTHTRHLKPPQPPDLLKEALQLRIRSPVSWDGLNQHCGTPWYWHCFHPLDPELQEFLQCSTDEEMDCEAHQPHHACMEVVQPGMVRANAGHFQHPQAIIYQLGFPKCPVQRHNDDAHGESNGTQDGGAPGAEGAQ